MMVVLFTVDCAGLLIALGFRLRWVVECVERPSPGSLRKPAGKITFVRV